MCKKELTEQAIQALDDLMCEFIKRYAPAKSWEQADEHFTSSEIAEMFNSVYPIPLENIFEALKSNGFTCVPLSGQPTFVWLLTLHPAASGRVYAAYGGVYVCTALLWLRFVDGIRLSLYDWAGALVALCGMLIIVAGWGRA